MMRQQIVTFIVFILAGLARAQSAHASKEDSRRVYTVCDVLQHLKDLNGKVIAVRGAIVGAGHGTFVSSLRACQIVVTGYRWPDYIVLENPTNSDGVHVEADPVGRESIRQQITRLHPSTRDQILVTYEGTLEAKELTESVSLNRAGKLAGFGFGPGVDAPAQLIIKTARDPAVIRYQDNEK